MFIIWCQDNQKKKGMHGYKKPFTNFKSPLAITKRPVTFENRLSANRKNISVNHGKGANVEALFWCPDATRTPALSPNPAAAWLVALQGDA